MKNPIYLLILFLLSSTTIFSQDLKPIPVVDERVELMSIVFKLADAEEYAKTTVAKYSDAIDVYFKKYKDDELIGFTKKIRETNYIGQDAVMSMAIHLEFVDNAYRLRKDVDTLIDKRWGGYSNKFVELLNQFYQRTNFHKFFVENKPLYSNAEEMFKIKTDKINYSWFKDFYGESNKIEFKYIVCMAIDGGGYGPKLKYLNGDMDIYSIIGVQETDSSGLPVFSRFDRGIIIHEFSHSFCNHIVEKHYDEIKSNSESMYKCVKKAMNKQAYIGAKIMMSELLVRSCVIKYMEKDSSISALDVNKAKIFDKTRGFYWLDSVISILEMYDKQRDKYATLESYMPELVKVINRLGTKEFIKNENRLRQEFIIESSIKDGDQNVDPNTNRLTLKFNVKMDCMASGITEGRKGKKSIPPIIMVKWDDNNQQVLTYSIKLEPNKEYSIAFPYDWYRDENGRAGKKGTYYLDFKTGDGVKK